MGWAYMVHPDAGAARVSDDPSVVEHYEGRGWVRHTLPAALDPDAPNFDPDQASVEEVQRIYSADEVAELKGQALDDALDAAGLSKSGTADEKRARLAEHEATLAATTDEGEVDNG
jgi:hypothetical protein